MRHRATKRLYDEVKAGTPGQRFRGFHERRSWRRRWRLAALLAGLVLVVVGILLGPVPVAPGFVFVLLGLGLLGIASRRVAGWLDRLEAALRRRWR